MTMLEKVAAAIAVEIYKKREWGTEVHELTQAEFEGIARAALEAMREPTPAMLDAISISEWLAAGKQAIRLGTAERWQAMINAAIEGK